MAAAEDEVLALVARLSASDTAFLTELGPLILASLAHGISADTRSFARIFEVSHALALRECVHLDADLGLLSTKDRGDKSGRLFLRLTPAGIHLTAPEVAS
ncbi:MAG: hypothetical protein AAF618_06000 [Pseudomonadota bacterium]